MPPITPVPSPGMPPTPPRTKELEAVRLAAAAGEPARSALLAAVEAGANVEDIAAATRLGESERQERLQSEALGEVARCVAEEVRSRRAMRESVISAHGTGLSTRAIASAAGLSFQRIAQIVAEGPDVPERGPKKKGSKGLG